MAKLRHQVENALNEARILVLGTQVLIGFQFRVPFEQRFPSLSQPLQRAAVVALGLLVFALVVLLSSPAYHHFVAWGAATRRFQRMLLQLVSVVLLPLAGALAIDSALAVAAAGRDGWVAWAAALGTGAMAIALWYGFELVRRRQKAPQGGHMGDDAREELDLSEQIKEVLTEARVVLPGAQALLGFQFIICFMPAFGEQPGLVRLVHLLSLAATALSTILLLAPSAYHRLVERGEDTARFLRFASRVVLAALVPLGLGLAGDTFVAVSKTLASDVVGLVCALAVVVLEAGLWFGWTLAVRARDRRRARAPHRQSPAPA